MQDDPAAAFAMGVDEIANRRFDVLMRECRDDKTALPGAIALLLPVLQGAAAADAEIGADGGDAFGRR